MHTGRRMGSISFLAKKPSTPPVVDIKGLISRATTKPFSISHLPGTSSSRPSATGTKSYGSATPITASLSALVPPSLVEGYLSSSLQLAWSVPDCGSCEANGIICELDNATSSQTICPHSKSGPYGPSGLSSAAKKA
ncbi:putative RING-H2 finger protein ATL21A [Prunus yedoensis var. nudiflora]|uniref:Putative RING-H2 finger protein ATL21A n=1 Tax=Prunus yedoensis var. nudiflora TaxID=2094558 RepID=A0A314ZF54_PRUYE|nr:putative RING-H2 finger protein ATL21A [Prunus yedoensis var. nudiflora]